MKFTFIFTKFIFVYFRQAPIGDDNYLLLAGRKDLSAHHQKVW